jgi:hypothetical protein
MEHNLKTAAMRLFGDFRRVRMVRKNGESQRIVQGENRVSDAGVTCYVVQNDGETRAGERRASGMRSWSGNRMGLRSAIRVQKGTDCGSDLAAATEKNRHCRKGYRKRDNGITRKRGRSGIHESD